MIVLLWRKFPLSQAQWNLDGSLSRAIFTSIVRPTLQVDEAGVPTDKLTGEALCTCQAIGSTAKTVKEAKEDPKVGAGRQ